MPQLESRIRDGIARLVLCHAESRSCYEKARALGFNQYQIVKAIYAIERLERYWENARNFMIASVGPDDIPLAKVLARHMPGLRLDMAGRLPECMTYGTCTPFMPPAVAETVSLIGVESPDYELRQWERSMHLCNLRKRIVDVAIGGADDAALRLSVHMQFSEMVACLHEMHGGKILMLDNLKK